jgi:hypothetical protein
MYRNKEKTFITFLEKNKIFTNFATNLKQNEKINDTEKLFSQFDSRNWFYSAFDWYNSPEGFDYWSNFNKKWQDYIS